MHITKADIDELKARTDLVGLILSAGVVLKKEGRAFVGLCPFLPETSPSFHVNPEAQLFNCFGACSGQGDGRTGALSKSGGDCLTFVMKWKGLSFPQAYAFLGGRPPSGKGSIGQAREVERPPAGAASPESLDAPARFDLGRAPRTQLLIAAVERWQKELSEDRQAQEALEGRGLVSREIWRAYRLGYSSGSLEDLCGTEASEARRHLLEMGLLYESDTGSLRETMRGRIVVPFFAFNQLPVSVYGRSVRDDLLPHHRLLRGPRAGLINRNAARGHQEIVLVESPYDALSLSEMGLHNGVPLCGAALLPDHGELVRRSGVGSVVVGLDADERGRKEAPVVAAQLAELGVLVRVVEWPEKDPNAVLTKHGPKTGRQIVDALLRAAEPCDLPAAQGASASAVASPAPLLPTACVPDVERDPAPATLDPPPAVEGLSIRGAPPLTDASSPDAPEAAAGHGGVSVREEGSPALSREALVSETLSIRYDDRRWDLTWLESPSIAQLRARVHLELRPPGDPPEAPPLLTFLDYLNLVASRARDAFCRRAVMLLLPEAQIPREALLLALQADLLRLADLGESRRKALSETVEGPAPMTEERRARALAYARSSHLLARLSADIEAMGYVGEESIKVLGYLVAISRKLPEALSMVILSSSGSGKSALAEVLEALTPPEDLLVVTRFTTSSLYWMGKDAVKRKFVSIEERAGSQEADYAIRALQSKRKLSMMAPIKDQATGRIETKLFEVEGPASFLESTTESRIHFENATRCYETRLDEREEQTRRIQEAQRHARTPEGRRAKARADETAAVHHDVQRVLRMVHVTIPYAWAIEFPSVWTRNRRDQPRLLNLIEALAFLHQYQRPLREAGTDALCDRPLEELGDEELDGVYVEATLDDYAAAVDLSGDLLEETLVELKRPLRDFLESFRKLSEEKRQQQKKLVRIPTASLELLEGSQAPALLARELRQVTRLQPHTVKRYLRELEELEYIAVTRGVRGAASAYRLVDLDEKPGPKVRGLLTVEELAQKLAKRRSAA